MSFLDLYDLYFHINGFTPLAQPAWNSKPSHGVTDNFLHRAFYMNVFESSLDGVTFTKERVCMKIEQADSATRQNNIGLAASILRTVYQVRTSGGYQECPPLCWQTKCEFVWSHSQLLDSLIGPTSLSVIHVIPKTSGDLLYIRGSVTVFLFGLAPTDLPGHASLYLISQEISTGGLDLELKLRWSRSAVRIKQRQASAADISLAEKVTCVAAAIKTMG